MANGTIRVEAVESVDGIKYIDQEPDLDHNVGVGDKMISYTPTPGVRYAKIRITEEGVAPISVSCIAGIK